MVRRLRSLSIALVIVLVSSVVSGQQPKRKREPYIAPLLPAEQAWAVALAAPPAAAAAMDDLAVYVPLEEVVRAGDDGVAVSTPAALIALVRETGATRWTSPVASRQPPVLTHGVIVLAVSNEIQAFDPRRGQQQWSVMLDRPVRAPMIARGSLLLALLEGDELVAIHLDRRQVAWRRSIGESGPLFMTADDQAAYIATNAGRAMRVMLSDGSIQWERRLQGELSEPTVDRGRLFVGSDAYRGSLWSLDARTGKDVWKWEGGVFGGAIVGTAVEGDALYVVSKDNIVRALNRGNGSQRWWKPAGTRPVGPPRVFNGVVTVIGVAPKISTFLAKGGSVVSTWAGPADALLQGPPLIEDPTPLRVAIVVVLRDGQVIGLRPTGMLFREPELAPLTVLPGRALQRER